MGVVLEPLLIFDYLLHDRERHDGKRRYRYNAVVDGASGLSMSLQRDRRIRVEPGVGQAQSTNGQGR